MFLWAAVLACVLWVMFADMTVDRLPVDSKVRFAIKLATGPVGIVILLSGLVLHFR